MKTGLVLEGGGLRALFSAGIMDVMMEHGLSVDGIIGVSAGATMGCNYKSQQRGRALRYNKQLCNDWRYCSLRSWLTTGDLVGAEYAYHYIPTRIDIFDNDAFSANPTEFCIVCTDTNTGKPVYHRLNTLDYNGLEWLRATASLPIVSRPVEIDGHRLLDGGICNSIPLEYWQSQGYGRNIVILTQPLGFRKKRTRLMPFFRLYCRQMPQIVSAMGRRHLMYNAQLDYIAQETQRGNTLLLCPETALDIGRTEMNAEKMQKIYDLGVKYAQLHLDKIKHFLSENDDFQGNR